MNDSEREVILEIWERHTDPETHRVVAMVRRRDLEVES